MQVGQLAIGIGIGLGLAVGSIGGWTTFQRLQAKDSAVAQSAQPTQSPAQPINQSGVQLASLNQPSQTITLTQAENDYLYDLSVALQPAEQRRLSNAEKLELGRQIAGWLQQGQDYWGVRTQFDRAYRSVLAGDYGHNRDVYIKFATERLAPAFVASLTPPPEVIVKTQTRYVETPGQTRFVEVPGETKVIREVVQVPEPFPVPVPTRPPHPYPGRPYPDRPYPDHHHPERPYPDDQAHRPDQVPHQTPEPHHPAPEPDFDQPAWPNSSDSTLNADAPAANPPDQASQPDQAEPERQPETIQVSAEPTDTAPDPQPAAAQ